MVQKSRIFFVKSTKKFVCKLISSDIHYENVPALVMEIIVLTIQFG